MKGGRFVAVGDDKDVLTHRGDKTQVVDLGRRTVIPGLNDSHLHLIRGGLNYNLELRWDGVPSLADALRMLREQARRTPPPQWVRVVGGWNEFQFAERRMPTLDEINAAAPDTPVFVLHLYDRALLNKAALRAVGYTKDTPEPPGGEIQRDKQGNPTGLLIARPNAKILYDTLAKGPKLPPEDQVNSTRLFMREMNRFGITSCIDAGGGYQNYPDDYKVIEDLAKAGELTVRIAYNLFTQRPKQEKEDFAKWVKMTKPGEGERFLPHERRGRDARLLRGRLRGLPRTSSRPAQDDGSRVDRGRDASGQEPLAVPPARHLRRDDQPLSRCLRGGKPRRCHSTACAGSSITPRPSREKNIERVKALGGGIAVQHRMAFQGEYFIDRYGKKAAEHSPPISRMLKMDVPVGAGTDGTRVASYNPWVSLYWLVTGKTVGGTALYPEANRLDRTEALRRYTVGSAWFSGEEDKKGSIEVGKLADLAVLSADYFSVPEEEIKRIESLLTVVDGKVVYAAGDFAKLAPPALPVSPDWSPVKEYGGYYQRGNHAQPPATARARPTGLQALFHGLLGQHAPNTHEPFWGPGCECFAF